MTTKSKFLGWMASIVVLVAFTQQATAAITYVDADSDVSTGNTLINNSAIIFEPTAGFNLGDEASSHLDGVWSDRTAGGEGGTVFTLFRTENGVADVLNTSVGFLTSNTYRVYAYAWQAYIDNPPALPTDARRDWDIKVNLNGGTDVDLVLGDTGSVYAGTQTFTATPLLAEGNRFLWAVDLGTFTGTGFTVNVAASSAGTATENRTWFDGVGYEVVPEPSSLSLLLGLGLPAFLARRRRK